MNSNTQDTLKYALQEESDASKLEHLASALLSRLLNVPIAIANSGYQYGGDAGPAEQQGRRFRLECKKYSDTTHINERELLGEIDQAMSRDSALEAWLLVSTRSIPEQTRQSLVQHGDKHGVPVLIFDWSDNQIASLAALCSSSPELVESIFSVTAGTAARKLQSESRSIVDMVRRDLESWCLGFESLRKRSHEKLDNIWNSPRESNSALGQNAAGGSISKRVERRDVQKALEEWWQNRDGSFAPAVVTGLEGTGKTWATLNWLIEKKTDQPIVLIVPSSAAMMMFGISESSVKRFLADRIYEITGVRDLHHWHQRLDCLLNRPLGEGPVLTVFFDGLNQEPTVEWLRFFKVLQAGKFSNRVRVIVTTRQHHYQVKLSMLRGLIIPPLSIEVGRYDDSHGGELDQMLENEGLCRSDLHADILEMARTPRLFDLVVRFRAKLMQEGKVTVHRLLWEYGRDTLGVRAERSFSEEDWRDWLREIANAYREGTRRFTTAKLSGTVYRSDLTKREVYARLSDVVDGRFTTRRSTGDIEFLPEVIAHALAAALLHHLENMSLGNFDSLDSELKKWLDPIAGLDEPAEVLRAAVSILVEQGRADDSPITGVLLTAWLQSQNVPDAHRQEIGDLALELTDALLDAVEHSNSHAHNSARLWAVSGLRKISKTDDSSLSAIVKRACCWLRYIFRDINQDSDAHEEHNDRRSAQLEERIGTDAVGPITVIDLSFELSDYDFSLIQQTIPSIIEGFPLSRVIPVFEYATTALAVSRRSVCWDALRWLCLINERDPDDTARELLQLSNLVTQRTTEPDIHPGIPERVAALLLLLTGKEIDEVTSALIDPRIDHLINYELDYLPNPSRSFFPLERRHANDVLEDMEVPVFRRAERIGDIWLDPTFIPTKEAFQMEIRTATEHFDFDKLSQIHGRSTEDIHFGFLEPALARCAPNLLAELTYRKLRSISISSGKAWYWRTIQATEHILFANEIDKVTCSNNFQGGDDIDDDSLSYAVGRHLLLEICDLDAKNQFEKIIDADLKFIPLDFSEVLRHLTLSDVDFLVTRYGRGTEKQQYHLVILFSIGRQALTNKAWSWLESLLSVQSDNNIRGVTFKTLAQSDAKRFGKLLLEKNWSWDPKDNPWVNHYGSHAFIEATLSTSFDKLIEKLAPWTLLEAVRIRGCNTLDVRLASEVFSRVLRATDIENFDPGSDLTVEMARSVEMPFSYSVELRPAENEDEQFRMTFDLDARNKALQRATHSAIRRIKEAREIGANLYLAPVSSEDFAPVIQTVPGIVDGWLAGVSNLTPEFQRRVRLAEGTFLALCEALLTYRPDRGVELWRALRKCMMTRFVGKAGVDELIHVVFRVPDSPEVTKIRREIADLTQCCTDEALLNLVIAALVNNKQDYIQSIIKQDQDSPYTWRQLRAKILEGFVEMTDLTVTEAWPEGELKTRKARIAHISARSAWRDACSRHWWKQYLDSEDLVQAYAAWILFLRSVDRRVWIWWEDELANINSRKKNELLRNKIIHACLNRGLVERMANKREEKFDQNFLNIRIEQGIGPWC